MTIMAPEFRPVSHQTCIPGRWGRIGRRLFDKLSALSLLLLVLAAGLTVRSWRFSDYVERHHEWYSIYLASGKGEIELRAVDVTKPPDVFTHLPPDRQGWFYRSSDRWDYRSYDDRPPAPRGRYDGDTFYARFGRFEFWIWKGVPAPPGPNRSGLLYRNWGAALPYRGVAVLAGMLPAAWWVRAIRRSRTRRRLRRGLCPRCGYDLRATPEWCPECGHETGVQVGAEAGKTCPAPSRIRQPSRQGL